MVKLWTESRGPILSTSLDVGKANAIVALLPRSIGLLPRTEGDPIKPFAIGIWNGFETLRKPGTSASPLRRAIGAYTHSKRYLFACAQPDAFRHDIDGRPVEPVSESDRLAAQEAFLRLSKGLPEDQPATQTLVDEVPPPSKSSLIRARLEAAQDSIKIGCDAIALVLTKPLASAKLNELFCIPQIRIRIGRNMLNFINQTILSRWFVGDHWMKPQSAAKPTSFALPLQCTGVRPLALKSLP